MKPQDWKTVLILFPFSTLSFYFSLKWNNIWPSRRLIKLFPLLKELLNDLILKSSSFFLSFLLVYHPCFNCPFSSSLCLCFLSSLLLSSNHLQSPQSDSKQCCVLWCVVTRGGKRLTPVESIQSDMLFTLTWPDPVTHTQHWQPWVSL